MAPLPDTIRIKEGGSVLPGATGDNSPSQVLHPLSEKTTLQAGEGVLANAASFNNSNTLPSTLPLTAERRGGPWLKEPLEHAEMQGPRPHPDLLSQSVCEQDPRRLVLQCEHTWLRADSSETPDHVFSGRWLGPAPSPPVCKSQVWGTASGCVFCSCSRRCGWPRGMLREPPLYSLTGGQAGLRGAQEGILEEARCELEGKQVPARQQG